LGFGFDDEEGVGIGVTMGAELVEGVVERWGEDGEDYGAVLAADEVEAEFGLDELEIGGHVAVGASVRGRTAIGARKADPSLRSG